MNIPWYWWAAAGAAIAFSSWGIVANQLRYRPTARRNTRAAVLLLALIWKLARRR